MDLGRFRTSESSRTGGCGAAGGGGGLKKETRINTNVTFTTEGKGRVRAPVRGDISSGS